MIVVINFIKKVFTVNNEIVVDGVTYVRKEEPKEKVAREFWLFKVETVNGGYWNVETKPVSERGTSFDCEIHVREVMAGEVVVTREKLLNIWKENSIGGDRSFNRVCAALGFKDE